MPSGSAPSVARDRSRRRRLRLALLVVLLLLTPVVSTGFGAASVPPGQVVGILVDHVPGLHVAVTWDRTTEAIVWLNRMPRIMAGLGVGAILSVAGVALQAVVRNALAEPYVLGVSAGASTGAAVGIIVLGLSSQFAVGGLAFVGALVVTAVVLGVGGRERSALQLILAGVAVGFVFQAVTNLVVFSGDNPETSLAVLFWTLGTLSRADWSDVPLVLAVAVLLTVGLWLAGPWLDALAGGDRAAVAVGLNPDRVRIAVLIPVSAGVAVAVAVAGGIGFVGLVVPHLMRMWIGHGHRQLIVGSALAGAIFLVAADTFSRTAFSPAEVPIGVITGLLGAPFLLLMTRSPALRG